MVNKKVELIYANVGHARMWPKKNKFAYKVFYTKVPINKDSVAIAPRLFSINRFNIFSIYTKDHGAKEKQKNWYQYIEDELVKAEISLEDKDNVDMICHPRIFGYAFNPISFWMISDGHNNLKAVLCEVRNTFKQSHNYLLCKANGSFIIPGDILIADKKLFVSPYNKNEGHYEFSFTYTQNFFKAVINYYDHENKHVLSTYVGGAAETLTSANIIVSLIKYPAMTLMVVIRINWQAIKLYAKKVKHAMQDLPKTYDNNRTTVSKKQK